MLASKSEYWWAGFWRGLRDSVGGILLIVLGGILLTAFVSVICFFVLRQRVKSIKTGDAKQSSCCFLKNKTAKICTCAVAIAIVLSSLIFCVVGAVGRTEDHYISPALAARLKLASVFDTDRVIKIYKMDAVDLLEVDLSELNNVLLQQTDIYLSLGDRTVCIFSAHGLMYERLSLPRNGFNRQVFYDVAETKALSIEGEGVVPVKNAYAFCYPDGYYLALYETDIGFVWGIYQMEHWSDNGVIYLAHEDFLRYIPQDTVLVQKEIDKDQAKGDTALGGYGVGYEDPTCYNPINVTLVREEGLFWTNSRLGTLYIVACAILHAAVVAAVWYVIWMRKKKRLLQSTFNMETDQLPIGADDCDLNP